MAPYERLRAWKASHQLVLLVYQATGTWPRHEIYGLTTQARRAAFSIASNIAEGAAKRGPREFRRFLDMAIGSTAELSYVLLVARDLGFLARGEWETIERNRDEAGKQLWRLYEAAARKG
ncbi:MAG: four helix bundle protein [Gemmatimonadales bacterium]